MLRNLGSFSVWPLVMLAASAMLLAGCAQDVNDLRRAGIDQYRGRQYIESMATMRHVLELESDDAEANYYMGLSYRALAGRNFRDGDVPAALRKLDLADMYFDHAIKNWPNYLAAVEAQNITLEERGKFEQALTVASRVASNNRGEAAEHFVYLGNEYFERGDYDNALRRYKIALAHDPNASEAYAAMGRLYTQLGDNALARDSLRRAYELDPGNTAVADALERLGTDRDTYPASHNPDY